MKIYVVAGTTWEYEQWLGRGGIRFEGVRFLLVLDGGTVRKLRPEDKLILLPCWQAHPNWRAIYNAMLATGRRGDR